MQHEHRPWNTRWALFFELAHVNASVNSMEIDALSIGKLWRAGRRGWKLRPNIDR